MVFKYKAIDSGGKKRSGQISVQSRSEAISLLKERGFTPLELKEVKGLAEITFLEKDIHEVRIKKKKILEILNQFAIMIKAGVSLSICLQVLVSQEKDRRLRKILEQIQEDMYSGYTLSASMGKFKAFSEVIVSIISSGEENGRLDIAFERAAKILDNEVHVSSKLKSALAYPLFLLGLTIVVLIILNIVVLPIFVDMFGQMGADLPLITRVVMGLSNIMMRFWYLFILLIVILIAVFKYGRGNSDGFRLRTDKWIMNLPLLGKLLQKLYISRFCRVMSSLINAGVEIIYALNVSKNVVPNLYVRQYFDHVLDDVRVGIPINQSMSKYSVFDSLFTSMVRVGEESGMLYDVLDKMGELYEVQTEDQTKLLTSLIEPIVTILIALVVGTVVISVVIPMFGQYSLML